MYLGIGTLNGFRTALSHPRSGETGLCGTRARVVANQVFHVAPFACTMIPTTVLTPISKRLGLWYSLTFLSARHDAPI